jgi:hypothetical protein
LRDTRRKFEIQREREREREEERRTCVEREQSELLVRERGRVIVGFDVKE